MVNMNHPKLEISHLGGGPGGGPYLGANESYVSVKVLGLAVE